MLPTCSALQTSSPRFRRSVSFFDCASSEILLYLKHPYTESPLPDFRSTAISRVTSVACEDDLVLKELLKQCAAELPVDQMRKAMEEHADNFDAHMDNVWPRWTNN